MFWILIHYVVTKFNLISLFINIILTKGDVLDFKTKLFFENKTTNKRRMASCKLFGKPKRKTLMFGNFQWHVCRKVSETEILIPQSLSKCCQRI